jgi:hypothetical protein
VGEIVGTPDREQCAGGVEETDVALDRRARLAEPEPLVERGGGVDVTHAEGDQADDCGNGHGRTVEPSTDRPVQRGFVTCAS